MLTDNVTDCHVLVIGSGGAGARAAIEASKYGETILLSASLAGKGGCTTMAEGGYNAVISCDDSCPLHIEDTMRGGAYLNDPELVDILVRESPERMADLVRWGAVFDVTPERILAQRPFGGQRFPRTCFAGDRTGHEMMMTLIERVRSGGIKIMQEISIINLLKDEEDKCICGAAGLNRRGEMVIIRADAVVLATGGLGQIYDVCTNCATGNGQGYAFGFRAGAELIDMEMVQFHPTGLVYPYDARGRLITEAVRGEGGVLKNKNGERFMKNYDPERMELSTRDIVSRAIATEILEGRGTDKGGVYLDVSHLPPKVIEERLPLMLEQFQNIGVDIRNEPMEVAPTAHHMMGGLRIKPDCSTSVPGLFACGEVTGGVHGANRLGGNSLADTQVFGKRAGESAGRISISDKKISTRQIEAEKMRLKAFMDGTESVSDIKNSLRKTMWENAGIFRTKEKLKTALSDIEILRRKKPKAASKQNLSDCCILEDMLATAELVVKGALLRCESRGAHVRKDIITEWTPENSPYGHTCQSLLKSGIEKRKGH